MLVSAGKSKHEETLGMDFVLVEKLIVDATVILTELVVIWSKVD